MASNPYNVVTESIFSKLDYSNFSVNFSTPPIVFVCGGPMLPVPGSLRERVFRYFANDDSDNISDHLIAAEEFKDYFQDGAYDDLMEFEDDIASISTLVIIFLESAGSLVELGLFCNRVELKDRLIVFVPSEELAEKDESTPAYSSFIYLGAMKSLKRRNETSVKVYPWVRSGVMQYDELEFVVNDIKTKLSSVKKTDKFDRNNSGHMAYLIHDIIRLCEPIKLGEIEMTLICLDIDVSTRSVTKSLYLLQKFKLVSPYEYSGSKYYYVNDETLSKINIGRTNNGKVFDFPNLKVQVRTSFVPALTSIEDKKEREISQKRFNALKKIIEIRKKDVPVI
ncbi:retron St85 family effector protein [Vibrio europaeus]|uniref:retron St85 family effector protein n=1 Tax=Vibrio europaeus TaxID=300876 RepID=UPI0023422563|nr:retron St85 family effector protein [Vibrio europaeus]MDC5849484.1 retron St85 family effector protein [Vibrio europaeus]